MSETQLSKTIRDTIRALGVPCFRINSGGQGGRRGGKRGVTLAPAGTPDLYTHLGWLEVKRPGEKPNENQLAWHAEAARFGVRVAVVESVRDAVDVVRRWQMESGL